MPRKDYKELVGALFVVYGLVPRTITEEGFWRVAETMACQLGKNNVNFRMDLFVAELNKKIERRNNG